MWVPNRGDDLSLLPRESGGAYRVISGGSNLLINDARSFLDVISMKDYDREIRPLGQGRYEVGCSVRVQRLIQVVNKDGYGGIEELVSIPGLIGGLICMNASVPSANVRISDHLVSVRAFVDGRVVEYGKPECGFGYRRFRFHGCRHLVLSAVFDFPEQDAAISASRIASRQEHCKHTQDYSAPNFGSVFRKHSDRIMGLVMKMGCDSGKVPFSRKRKNWMLNEGGAFSDAMAVIKRVERLHALAHCPCEREVVVWG